MTSPASMRRFRDTLRGRLLRALLGIGLASLAAGPVLFSVVILVAWTDPGTPVFEPVMHSSLSWPILLDGLRLFAGAALIGSMFALGPNTIGTVLMALGGRFMHPLRHPLAWGLAGAAGGYLFTLLLGSPPEDLRMIGTFTLTGTACALICRSAVRWRE